MLWRHAIDVSWNSSHYRSEESPFQVRARIHTHSLNSRESSVTEAIADSHLSAAGRCGHRSMQSEDAICVNQSSRLKNFATWRDPDTIQLCVCILKRNACRIPKSRT